MGVQGQHQVHEAVVVAERLEGATHDLQAEEDQAERDNHFTSLTVSSLTGEAALCVVIFKGERADCTMFVHMPKTQFMYSPT